MITVYRRGDHSSVELSLARWRQILFLSPAVCLFLWLGNACMENIFEHLKRWAETGFLFLPLLGLLKSARFFGTKNISRIQLLE